MADRLRPKFCPNCAALLPEGPHGAQGFGTGEKSSDIEGWDCFCDVCYWSGDIKPDYEAEAQLEIAKAEGGR